MMSFLSKLFVCWCCCFPRSQAGGDDDSNSDYDSVDGVSDHGGILIGAFNCNNLGERKFKNSDVVENYYKILSRYHLILLQEIQDKDFKHIPEFLNGLNRYSQKSFKYVISDPLGRKSRKEQYLYLYRESTFKHVENYLYNDGSEQEGNDTFEREPFVVKFRSRETAVEEFAIIGARLHYEDVEQELNQLVSVYHDLVNRWGDIPVLIMGDFLADGTYLPKSKLEQSELRREKKFHWLIEEDVDTTVSKNKKTYDRIIVVGEELYDAIVEESATVFEFDKEFDIKEAKSVSDHYPVEFLMRGRKGNNRKQKVKDERPPDPVIDVDEIIPKLESLRVIEGVKQDVRVGAFNIQRLSSKKLTDGFVREYLFKILGRYDLVFVQEVQVGEDRSIIQQFVDELKSFTQKDYDHQITEPIGRKRYKEQYLYIYRTDVFQIVDHFIYDDGSEELGDDTFSREPFVIRLKSSKSPEFAVIGCHIAPKSVAKEMEELVKVHQEVRAKWGNQLPTVIMGDFNAEGFLSKRKKHSLTLWQDKTYHWLLDNTDTTVARNDNNYDRIIVSREELFRRVQSAAAYRFDDEFKLSMEDAGRISDHYPVEFMIGGMNEKDEL